MLEIGRRFDLDKESRRADDGGEFWSQHFNSDIPVVFEVVREVHGGHAARTEFTLNAVAVGEGSVQARTSCGAAHCHQVADF